MAFGFVHQCRNISPHTKVLATAFSNVGADNLAEAVLKLGLKIVRIGKPSAVTEALWEYTLDAAIGRDDQAQRALADAARATAALSAETTTNSLHMGKKGKTGSTQSAGSMKKTMLRDAATRAVRKSIEVCIGVLRERVVWNLSGPRSASQFSRLSTA